MGVFDGHGGWQVSELAMKKMHLYIDEELSKSWSKGDKEIVSAIEAGFDRLEKEWIEIA